MLASILTGAEKKDFSSRKLIAIGSARRTRVAGRAIAFSLRGSPWGSMAVVSAVSIAVLE
jgi:hypothetical protein